MITRAEQMAVACRALKEAMAQEVVVVIGVDTSEGGTPRFHQSRVSATLDGIRYRVVVEVMVDSGDLSVCLPEGR